MPKRDHWEAIRRRLLAAFENKGCSYQDVAQDARIPASTICRTLQGRTHPKYETVAAIARILGVAEPYDTELLQGGWLGLQQCARDIETHLRLEPGHTRMAIQAHIPAHMRQSSLSKAKGYTLYEDQKIGGDIAQYVALVNERREAVGKLVSEGRVTVREIYSKPAIEDYVRIGLTRFDRQSDPFKERIERLQALREFLDHESYQLGLLDEKEVAPRCLLHCGVEVLIDLRRRGSPHIADGVDGVYTTSSRVLMAVEQQFRDLWLRCEIAKKRNSESIEGWLRNLEAGGG